MSTIININNEYIKTYSKINLYLLFSLVAFPIHAWAIFRSFYQVKAILLRTHLWDAVTYCLYAGISAFISSLLVFVAVLVVSYLAISIWQGIDLIIFIGATYLVVCFWNLISLTIFSTPAKLERIIGSLYPGHFLRAQIIFFLLLILLVIASVIVVFLLVNRSQRFKNVFRKFIQGIMVLSTMYFVFDVVGVMIFIIRSFEWFIQ